MAIIVALKCVGVAFMLVRNKLADTGKSNARLFATEWISAPMKNVKNASFVLTTKVIQQVLLIKAVLL